MAARPGRLLLRFGRRSIRRGPGGAQPGIVPQIASDPRTAGRRSSRKRRNPGSPGEFLLRCGNTRYLRRPPTTAARGRRILQSLIANHPDRPRYRADLARVLTSLLFLQSDFERALALQRERRQLWEQIHRERPDYVEGRYAVAWCQFDDARLDRTAGQLRDALGALDQAAAIVENVGSDAQHDRDLDFLVRLLADPRGSTCSLAISLLIATIAAP